ncbi:MAG: DinB family protein [Gemmatimonadaceae bacterium]
MHKTTDRLIKNLERTRDEVVRYFALGDAELARTYAPGKWSVRYLLHHLADSELVLGERLRRVISEPGFVIWYFDQDLWEKALDYSTRSLSTAKAVFEVMRNANIELARRHYEKDGAREFVHSRAGVRTLREEFEQVAEHTEHHLEQVRQALR